MGTAVRGTKGVPNINNTPDANYEAAEWTDNNGNFWLLTDNGYFYKYDPVSNMWTWMDNGGTVWGVQGVPSVNNFPGSRGYGAVTWTDNNNNLWLYAGVAFGWDDNLWKYNIATNEWTWMKGTGASNCAARVYGTLGVAAAANTPGSRAEVSVSWKDNNGDLWFYGGQACTGNSSSASTAGGLSDVWKYEMSSNNWIWMNGSTTNNQPVSYGTQGVASAANTPGGRFAFAGGQLFNNSILFFGGPLATGSNTLANAHNNDIWKYDLVTNQWTWLNGPNASGQGAIFGTKCVPSTTNRPGSGYEVRTRWTDSCGNLWLFGTGFTSGSSGSSTCNDLWTYSRINNTWMWVSGTNQQNNTGIFGTQGVSSPNNIPPSTIMGGNPFYYKTAFYLFGGGSIWNNKAYNTLWKYEPDKPTAGFTVGAFTGCVPINANFTSTSTPGCNEIKNYLWNFGDPSSGAGNTSTLQNPSHPYNAAGTYTVTLIVTNCTGSKDTTSQSITITGQATNNNQNASICVGANYTLPGGTIVNTAGTYIDTLTATNGCDSIITTVLTLTNSININSSATICNGNNYTLPWGSVINTAGVYKDTITSTSGCDSIFTITINVLQNSSNTINSTICNGNSYTLPSGNNVSIAGNYYDTLQSANGCDSVITTNLTVMPNSAFNQNPIICSGQTFTLPDGTIVSANGNYNDTLLSSNGCDSIITTTLTVNQSPSATVSPDVTIFTGSNTTLTASGGNNYNWSPSTGLNTTTGNSVIATPNQTTIYCVTITDNNGCADTACVTVTVEIPCYGTDNFKIPNAFSPNGDNINDEFCLQGWDKCIESFLITVYDRWGEKVYQSDKTDFCWDGTYKGKKLDAQVFVYYVTAVYVKDSLKLNFEGNISLIK